MINIIRLFGAIAILSISIQASGVPFAFAYRSAKDQSHGISLRSQKELDKLAEELAHDGEGKFDYFINGDVADAIVNCYNFIHSKESSGIGLWEEYYFSSIIDENKIRVRMFPRLALWSDEDVEASRATGLFKIAKVRTFDCVFDIRIRTILSINEIVQ